MCVHFIQIGWVWWDSGGRSPHASHHRTLPLDRIRGPSGVLRRLAEIGFPLLIYRHVARPV